MKIPDLLLGPGLLLNPFRSPAGLRRVQERKLRRLVRHAYEHVAHYREAMDERGLRPDDIRGLEDLARLPILTKERLQSLPVEAKTADNVDLGHCREFMTSGTTGLPLRFYVTARDLTYRNLVCARTHKAAGIGPRDKIAVIAGDLKVNRRVSFRQRLGLWRRREISSWLGPDAWIEEMLSWKPTAIIGRVTTLRILGERMRDRGIDGIRPRIILSSAEMLDDGSRRFFRETFGSRVVDHYGCFETGCAAWECRVCGGYHVNADFIILEALAPDGRPARPGEPGEVIVTNLHNLAMPFIRYRQGDDVVPSAKPARCGRGFPLLDRIDGRRDDRIVRLDGRRIPPQAVYHVLIPVPGVRRWRVEQNVPGRVTVLVEPREDFGPQAERVLVDTMQTLIGKDMAVDVVLVERFEADPARKTRTITVRIE